MKLRETWRGFGRGGPWQFLDEYGDYELVAPEQPKPEPEACDPTGLYYTRGEVHAAIDSRVSDAIKQERERLAKAVRRSYAKDLMMFVKKLADELERGEG